VSTAGEQFYVLAERGNGWLAAVRSEAVSEVGEGFGEKDCAGCAPAAFTR